LNDFVWRGIINKKLITYHFHKSTGLGGVESLVRNLQDVSLNLSFDVEEIYHGVYGEEINKEKSGVIYSKLFANNGAENFFQKMFGFLYKRINLYNHLLTISKDRECSIFVFHPKHLLQLPNSVMRRSKIVFIQTNKFEIIFAGLGGLGFKRSLDLIDHITVYTGFDREKLINLFPDLNIKEKVSILPRGCRFTTTNKVNRYSKKLVTIARIDETQKNFTSMVEVMKLLPEEYTLDIYGNGTDDSIDALEKLIASEDRISYRGVTRKPDEILKQYSVFILTSHFEGFGQTLIEARSQGLPIVAFETFDALKWIVTNGANGKIVAPYDHSGFAAALKVILTDESVYSEFSNNAIVKSVETDLTSISDKWRKLISN